MRDAAEEQVALRDVADVHAVERPHVLLRLVQLVHELVVGREVGLLAPLRLRELLFEVRDLRVAPPDLLLEAPDLIVGRRKLGWVIERLPSLPRSNSRSACFCWDWIARVVWALASSSRSSLLSWSSVEICSR